MNKILVIDDDRDMRTVLAKYLLKNNYQVIEATNGKSALEVLDRGDAPDLILCDFRLGDTDGASLLQKIKQKQSHVPVVFITGYGDIKIAVEVMRLGAFDYITKPLIPQEILVTIRKALEKGAAKISTIAVSAEKNPAQSNMSNHYIFGNSKIFNSLLDQVKLVAPTNYSVIIYGETGSGKEGIAQEIHKRSKRKNKPFIAIDCGALSKELASSELFGHEKGAFTGALFQKTGSFEIANGGTLFLDEITNLPYDVQVSLLRVVQERKMRKVGGVIDIDLDVRIIIASNEKLWSTERNSNLKFREDLFHRFNEFSITVPPLRERKEDIKVFAEHFLQITNSELGKSVQGFTDQVTAIFQTYVWPGNLRELKNVIKRAVLLTEGTHIDVQTIPIGISNAIAQELDTSSQITENKGNTFQVSGVPDSSPEKNQETLKGVGIDAEYDLILSVLKKVKFNKTKTAKILNIDRKTLYNKLDQYELLNEK
jgi:two-component system response regulator HydG